MKKKIIITVSIAAVLILVAAVVCMNLFGGSHTAIDNNPESDRRKLCACRLFFLVGQRTADGKMDLGGNGRRSVPNRSD